MEKEELIKIIYTAVEEIRKQIESINRDWPISVDNIEIINTEQEFLDFINSRISPEENINHFNSFLDDFKPVYMNAFKYIFVGYDLSIPMESQNDAGSKHRKLLKSNLWIRKALDEYKNAVSDYLSTETVKINIYYNVSHAPMARQAAEQANGKLYMIIEFMLVKKS